MDDFVTELSKIYNDLLERQEQLGEEFEQVWLENLDDLYEYDE